jgi:hypothetical protein
MQTLRLSMWTLLDFDICKFGSPGIKHPAMIVANAYGPRVKIVCRSSQPITDPDSQLKHKHHSGLSDHQGCGINLEGYVAWKDYRFVPAEDLHKKVKCVEPDENFFELVDSLMRRASR